ncbi:DUF6318 family protein [uncultured Rothia sp.]|uniref:DUF6318 family protein n=1 Tax=uncultured Rothia sp. TaxID=316088 RepID=UPI0025D95EE4|nr:DUF6318 family protein [uncultured Rothia sp.]
MDSTIFTRRTLLGSGTLVGLGALLTACGQQANNEAAATASAAPSETAAASATASKSPSASATPSTVRGYSGGSKAPDGEYRPADGKGPAQNVPKPPNRKKYPETQEGALSMMNDWTISHNYAVQTGDCEYAKVYVKKETDEDKFYEYVERLYKRGGWIINGLDKYQLEGQFIYDEKSKEYTLMLKHIWEYTMYIEPDGSYTEDTNTTEGDDNGAYILKYSDGFWTIVGSLSQEQLKEKGLLK